MSSLSLARHVPGEAVFHRTGFLMASFTRRQSEKTNRDDCDESKVDVSKGGNELQRIFRASKLKNCLDEHPFLTLSNKHAPTKSPTFLAKPASSTAEKRNRVCPSCHKSGHYRKTCPVSKLKRATPRSPVADLDLTKMRPMPVRKDTRQKTDAVAVANAAPAPVEFQQCVTSVHQQSLLPAIDLGDLSTDSEQDCDSEIDDGEQLFAPQLLPNDTVAEAHEHSSDDDDDDDDDDDAAASSAPSESIEVDAIGQKILPDPSDVPVVGMARPETDSSDGTDFISDDTPQPPAQKRQRRSPFPLSIASDPARSVEALPLVAAAPVGETSVRRSVRESRLPRDFVGVAFSAFDADVDQLRRAKNTVRKYCSPESRTFDEPNKFTTHVVLYHRRRTMKVMRGMALGAEIVRPGWLTALKKDGVDVAEATRRFRWAPFKKGARRRECSPRSPIDGMTFFLSGTYGETDEAPTRVEMKRLITTASATVVSDLKMADVVLCSRSSVLYDTTPADDLMKQDADEFSFDDDAERAPKVKAHWLFDSLTAWKALPFDKYFHDKYRY